ncbi:MAG TPA: BTAD domain-containing putative transcriptional regulator [Gemmatimonadaceae bacterium]|nr:BTAD domain-containing putative transcriptional regulator [Gemmatimonadaceae bacterium]
MIQLRLLGSIDLRDAEGRELRRLLVRPKQVALLACLALRSPGEWLQRGGLLALLWPESDERRARLSLRNALYALRTELGADVVLSRGDDEVMLDASRVSCDTDGFTRALAAGDYELALSLYRGPLLEGLAVTGLHDFDAFLDGRRDSFRRSAANAAMTLSDRAFQASEFVAAERWAAQAVELSPYEEVAIRRQLLALEQLGDGAAASQAFARWATRLRNDLDVTASAETTDLARRVGAGRAPTATSVAPVRAPPATDYGAPPGIPPVAPAISRWRRAPHVAVAAGVLILLGTLLAVRFYGISTPPERRGTAVLPFTYVGTTETSYLGDAISTLMSASLSDAGVDGSIDPSVIATRLAARKVPAGGLDVRDGSDIARAVRARQFVVGTVVRAGPAIRVEAFLYDADGGSAQARASAQGSTDSLFAIADRVAQALFAERIGRLPPGALGTTSVDALRAYVEGERELLGARYAPAADAFQRAVRADSMFGRGYYRLSYAAGWAGRSDQAISAAARALALKESLSDADRPLVLAWSDFMGGRIREAQAGYESAVRADDRRVEAWLQLGELRYHWGAMLGVPPSAAADAFRRVLALAPDQGAALIHLARYDARELANGGGFDSLARAVAQSNPTTAEAREMRALTVALRGSDADRAALVHDAIADGFADAVVQTLMSGPGEASLPLAIAVQNARLGDDNVGVSLQLVQLAATRLQFARAEAELNRLENHHPERAAEVRAWLALLPGSPVDAKAAARTRARLAALRPAQIPPGGNALEAHAVFDPRRLFLIGALALRDGDEGGADAIAGQLERGAGADTLSGPFRRVYARLLRAQIHLRAGRPAAAVDALGVAAVEPGNTFPGVMSFANALERFVRAQALEEAGRPREALIWYRTFPDMSGYDSWFLPAVIARRASLEERLGEGAAALADRQRLARLVVPDST